MLNLKWKCDGCQKVGEVAVEVDFFNLYCLNLLPEGWTATRDVDAAISPIPLHIVKCEECKE